MSFVVKTPEYEGPLEKLLALVQERKMHVSDIALADVASSYLSYVAHLPEQRIPELADFLSIATTLLLLKSRSLLPQFTLSQEEEYDAQELKDRLERYQMIQKWRKIVSSRWRNNAVHGVSVRVYNPINKAKRETNLPSAHMIEERVRSIISNLPKPLVQSRIRVSTAARLADVLETLSRRFESAYALKYSDLVGEEADKVTRLLHFLALLELLKRETISVNQDGYGADITIESRIVSLPRYA